MARRPNLRTLNEQQRFVVLGSTGRGSTATFWTIFELWGPTNGIVAAFEKARRDNRMEI
jgi:hypothetical protein